MAPKRPYTIPPLSKRDLRNKEQERKRALKKLKRSVNRLKRERKQQQAKISTNDDAANPEACQYESSDKESDHPTCNEPNTSRVQGQQVIRQKNCSTNINLPNSSSKEPSATSSIGKQALQKKHSDTKSKNSDISCSSCTKPSPAQGQQVNKRKNGRKKRKNRKVPNSTFKESTHTPGQQVNSKDGSWKKTDISDLSCNELSTSRSQGQVTQQNDSIKASENSRIEQPSIQEKFSESRKIGKNMVKVKGSSPKNSPPNFPNDEKMQRVEQVKMQLRAENKGAIEIETIKPLKGEKLPFTTTKHVASKLNRKTIEDLSDKMHVPQKKVEECKKVMKSPVKQHKLKPLFGKIIVVNGFIELLPKPELPKSIDGFKYALLNHSRKTLNIEDESVKMSIEVEDGMQVICNLRRRHVQNCPAAEKSEVGVSKVEKDGKTNIQNYDESTSDTSNGSHSVNNLSSNNSQTVYDQAVGIPNMETETGSMQDEPSTNSEQDLSGIDEFSADNEIPLSKILKKI